MSELSNFRKPPFCCGNVVAQTPFYKYENYPRSYVCVLDFVALATSIPYHVPTSKLTRPLTDYDFIIRLCKGLRNPDVSVNQLGHARYYLPDSSVPGGIIEVVDNECTHLQPLLGEPKQETYVHLEDVWITYLCPVHLGIVWFLQFWVRGPRSEEEVEEVTRRVRARRSGDPNSVEDEFTLRFNELRGLPTPQPNPPKDTQPSQLFGEEVGGDVVVDKLSLWHDHLEVTRPFFVGTSQVFDQQQRTSPVTQPLGDFPSGHTGPFGDASGESAGVLPFFNMVNPRTQPGAAGVPNYTEAPQKFLSIHQPEQLLEMRGSSIMPGYRALTSGQALRGVADPLHISGRGQQPISPAMGFLPPIEAPFEGQPYGICRPEPPVLPLAHQPLFVSKESATKEDEWCADINPLGGLSSTGPSNLSSSPGFQDPRSGAIPMSDDQIIFPNAQQQAYKPQQEQQRDTSVAGASRWAPPAGNTTGLRPVQRRTWNVEKKEWSIYWVWAL